MRYRLLWETIDVAGWVTPFRMVTTLQIYNGQSAAKLLNWRRFTDCKGRGLDRLKIQSNLPGNWYYRVGRKAGNGFLERPVEDVILEC